MQSSWGVSMKQYVVVGSVPDWASEISSIILPLGTSLKIAEPQFLYLSKEDSNHVCGGFN